MNLVPKREYITLLIGDVVVFTTSLWLTLALRYLMPPSRELFVTHAVPFALLFVVWVIIFFLAGLYGRHTRLFRSRLLPTIFFTQLINTAFAALFFFFIPWFGITPKTTLLLYLVVSAALIFLWRVTLFPRLRGNRKLHGVLIASGADAQALAEEVARDTRAQFTFDHVIDTKTAPPHEVIQRACRLIEDKRTAFLVADFSDKAVASALPILYDAVFRKERFALIDVIELYQETFEHEPLSLIDYRWILAHVTTSHVYDALKRAIDVAGALVVGFVSLIFYPFVIFAIKLEDGGPIFVKMPRIGRYQREIQIIKFRSMTGNDAGNYGTTGKSRLEVTRVGKWLRVFRVDELPQVWNILRGDLSFVGPRPETPTLAAQYNARIPFYTSRSLIKPGLTGWAQLKHDRHPHHGLAVAETREKLSYDLYYLQHRSLFLDIFIMLQTIRIVLTARGS